MSGVSVIVTTYHPGRRDYIDEIARAWLGQPVEEVWVLNGGADNIKCEIEDCRLKIFNLPFDLGNGADYCFALMTSGDYVVLADDDLVPCEGFVERCLEHSDSADILGVMGRVFKGPKYRGNTSHVRGLNLDDEASPVPVDFVGICTFCRREHFGFDVRGLFPALRNCDDLWWQMKKMPHLSKAVIPVAELYRNLRICSGATSMFNNIDLKKSRQDFYEKYYLAGQYYSAIHGAHN